MEHLEHFGLTQDPFQNNPQLAFYFASPQHTDAERRLLRGVRQGKGLSVIVGASGSGKTTLVSHLMEGLDEDAFEASLIVMVHTGVDSKWLLACIARQLGVAEPAPTRVALVGQIYRQLVAIREEGRRPVIVIDEAQMLTRKETQTELRGLLNLEWDEERLISLVLSGLPELEQTLALDPPLAERVDIRVELACLDAGSASAYLAHRVRTAGGDPEILHPQAVARIAELSEGIPRRLNTLADNALFESYLAGRRQVSIEDVDRAAQDLSWARKPEPEPEPAPVEAPRAPAPPVFAARTAPQPEIVPPQPEVAAASPDAFAPVQTDPATSMPVATAPVPAAPASPSAPPAAAQAIPIPAQPQAFAPPSEPAQPHPQPVQPTPAQPVPSAPVPPPVAQPVEAPAPVASAPVHAPTAPAVEFVPAPETPFAPPVAVAPQAPAAAPVAHAPQAPTAAPDAPAPQALAPTPQAPAATPQAPAATPVAPTPQAPAATPVAPAPQAPAATPVAPAPQHPVAPPVAPAPQHPAAAPAAGARQAPAAPQAPVAPPAAVAPQHPTAAPAAPTPAAAPAAVPVSPAGSPASAEPPAPAMDADETISAEDLSSVAAEVQAVLGEEPDLESAGGFAMPEEDVTHGRTAVIPDGGLGFDPFEPEPEDPSPDPGSNFNDDSLDHLFVNLVEKD